MINQCFVNKVLLFTLMYISAGCAISNQEYTTPAVAAATPTVTEAKLLNIEDVKYLGAFAISADTFGRSSANWSNGVIHVEGDRFFITGHNHNDNIAEFILPPLTLSNQLGDLKIADQSRQNFAPTYTSNKFKNTEKHDHIAGLYEYNGSLIVNSMEYYDAPGDNLLTTFVLKDSANLKDSAVAGMHALQGAARVAGWISKIPENWQPLLKGTHISGNSSGFPIISRLSVGPSAFVFDIDSLISRSTPGKVQTKEVLGFTLDRPLHPDLYNKTGKNSIWTHVSEVRYGFIVPGTATYMTIGVTGGHSSGVGYKVVQDNGFRCAGFCPNSASDYQNYYWLWDVRDMVLAGRGRLNPDELKPYSSGPISLPSWSDGNTPSISHNESIRVGGASFDVSRNILYVSVLNTLLAENGSVNPPIVVGFQIGQ